MVRIKTALISVYDKEGIVDFAQRLNNLGIKIISSGGTAKILRENNIGVLEVSDYTSFPEMLSGRVKTLHPKIHAGILALRDNLKHMQELEEHNIEPIDMVVVNLYPFGSVIKKKDISLEEVIEFIDIGGVSLLRSAAKNYRSVAVICNPKRYREILEELEKNNCSLSEETLKDLAIEIFDLTTDYDTKIFNYLNEKFKEKERFPQRLLFSLEKIKDVRYGENPHQKAALYKSKEQRAKSKNLVTAKQLCGKELSFNNLLDLNSAWELVNEFFEPAAVIIKHNNPCGVAIANSLDRAYRYAWDCDRKSAFGGIVGLNSKVDLKTAREIKNSGFLECIIAPNYERRALEILKEKKGLRILELQDSSLDEFDLKKIGGGVLLQEKDSIDLKKEDLKVVTKNKPTKKQSESLIFAFKVAKHIKSNAIVLVKGKRTVGIGAGQMSRVDSVFMAIKKAEKNAKGACLASDGFFPKSDSIILAKRAGISAIIQPGGSIADKETIDTCNKFSIPMVFTGIRHFKH